MVEFIKNFYQLYILWTPVETPAYVYVLMHLFFILPINAFAFWVVFKNRNASPQKNEVLLKRGALLMGLVLILRYSLYYVYVYISDPPEFHSIIKFEMSEIAMYLLILAIFVIKKQWFYPLAFTVGLISCIAVFGYPYTVFANRSALHLYALSSIFFHALNGYMSCMLITARGYTPRLKQTVPVLIGNVGLFIIILIANRVTGENFMALSDSSQLPIIGNVKPPVNVIIIYLVFNLMTFAVLSGSELAYRKLNALPPFKIPYARRNTDYK
jgi:hypothetical protein